MIEKGAQVRVKLIGLRSDVGSMYAIGSIKEDYLGSVWSSSHLEIICAKLQQCATAVNDLAIPNTTCECTLRKGIWKALRVGCVAPLLDTIMWSWNTRTLAALNINTDNTVRGCGIYTRPIGTKSLRHVDADSTISQNDIKAISHPAFNVIITCNM